MYESSAKEFVGGVSEKSVNPKLKQPLMYRVILINDDYTPMEFVVVVLMEIFTMTRVRATEVMLAVHYEGRGVCGVFTREIAEAKVAQVNAYARSHEYPLLCTMEVC